MEEGRLRKKSTTTKNLTGNRGGKKKKKDELKIQKNEGRRAKLSQQEKGRCRKGKKGVR